MLFSLAFSGISRYSLRRRMSALRAIPVGPRRLVKSKKSKDFSNISMLMLFTLETAIYRKPEVNSLEVILITALSRVIP